MLEPKRIESNVAPKVFDDLGNGNWYYNYDIQSEEVKVSDIEGNESVETRYNYIQIKMTGKPDYKRCVEYIIREHITQSQEFDLINSYNRAILNLLSEDEVEQVSTKYLNYLQKVSEIKSKIKEDFK